MPTARFSAVSAPATGRWRCGISYRKESIFQTTPNPSNEYPAFLGGQLIGSVIPTQPSNFPRRDSAGFCIGRYGYTAPWPTGSPTVTVNGVPTGGIPGLYYVPTGFLGDAASSTIEFSSERTFAGDSVVKRGLHGVQRAAVEGQVLVNSLSADLAHRGPIIPVRAHPGLEGRRRLGHQRHPPAACDAFTGRARGLARGAIRHDARRRHRQQSLGADHRSPDHPVGRQLLWRQPEPEAREGGHLDGRLRGHPDFPAKASRHRSTGTTSVITDAIDKPTPQQIVNAAYAGDPQYQALVNWTPQ